MTVGLYTPPDRDEAWETWKCSCGPGALAALLSRKCEEVRDLFPGYERRGYANPTHLREALDLAGVKHHGIGAKLPTRGLAFLQIEGPWTRPGVPVGAAYRHTHWVAVAAVECARPVWIYDVNAEDLVDGPCGGWLPFEGWEQCVMPHIVTHYKGATGWRVRLGIEVAP